MGYMGFGMRKEDYKRKPKKPFKKHRKTSIPEAQEGSEAGYRASQTYNQIRLKPIRERRWFRFLILLSTLFLFWLLLDVIVLDAVYYKYRARQFEKAGMAGYYAEEAQAVDSVFHFMDSQQGRIASISISDSVRLRLRSDGYFERINGRTPRAHHLGLDYFGKTEQFEITEGNLKFKYHDYYRTHKEYWSCDMKLSSVSEIPSRVFDHLQTDAGKLQNILNLVNRLELKVTNYQHGTVLSLSKFGKPYSIIATNDILYLERQTGKKFKQLKPGIYALDAALSTEELAYKND
jgi:hypothetical protein